uniref:Leucine-rich repeat-containing protein 41 n=1 Tax=Myotis myotis TaxID=51298 RepID=A0A7J7ZYU6_MYOMY|nr:leucine rich repeat containing 41 [Myotis myotis]
MSAGFWQPGPGGPPCRLCGEASRGRAPSRDESSLLLGSRRPRRDAAERCAAALMASRRKSEAKQMARAPPTTRVTRRSTQESLRAGLGSNIFRLLDSLRALSGQAGCRLRALHLSDLFSPLPILELTRAIVRALPLLRVLSIRVDHPSQRDNPAVPGNAGPPSHIIGDEEIPENCLEQLEMGFPRGAQSAPLLCSVLKASGSLQQLSLDSTTFASPQDFGLVLQTLKEYNLALKKLSFHDMNLADCQSEVLFLLQNLTLQEITFSFCRLFEKRPAQFLPEMVAAMKGNSTLKGLRLPGNRLGNAGLLALADVFSEDSSSSLCQLDISSNCIKPDGLLEFAKRLERWGRGAFGHLRLFQNWLDQDAVTAREAIRRLRATCHVVSDSWDSSQAFADYVSTM